MDNRYLYSGKKISTGEWVYGNITEKACGIKVIVNDFTGDICMVDPSTVGRCTGLYAAKSYRGTEPEDLLIFEGDIVQNDIAKGIVKFGNPDFLKDSLCSMFYWEITEQLDYTHFCFEDDVFTEFKDVEITGTIHDTPELLKT